MPPNFKQTLLKAHRICPGCPSPVQVRRFIDDILGLLFPQLAEEKLTSLEHVEAVFAQLSKDLRSFLDLTVCQDGATSPETIRSFLESLEEIRNGLLEDVDAIYSGDPAAKTKNEVIRAYPGFFAVACYRLAHKLLDLGTSTLPRLIAEYAHSKTGIDIHPGAQIGRNFCIDHGTGVVIGETSIIGDHVKIYQGVTLGGLSVAKDMASTKRHPTIENHVVIYAGATILGGDTVIGQHSIIGGNVWLTKSVPAHSKIYYQANLYDKDTNETDLIVIKNLTS